VFQECYSTFPSMSAKQNEHDLVFSVTRKGPTHFGFSLPEASVRGIRSSTKSPASMIFCVTFLSL
jgi:hypothetical protein